MTPTATKTSYHGPGNNVGRVPELPAERARLQELAVRYVADKGLQPPLGADEIRAHARRIAISEKIAVDHLAFLTVLVGNAIWEQVVAAIPFDRRLLLLPQCLSRPNACRAERDDVGLICAACGSCSISTLQAEAEKLGYATLVAEGTTVVRKLILGGKIDAIVGVGCLSSLERVLPDMCAHAIPGIGLPLLRDGCHETDIEESWVLDVLKMRATGASDPIRKFENLRHEVETWFDPAGLDALLGQAGSHVEQVGRAWLARGGKRWRPLLTAGVYAALSGRESACDVRAAAVAVECFHKASLAHDDIEDNDDTRYGLPTLHCEHGVPIAINAGDFLIGEGYRLLTSMTALDAVVRNRLFEAAVHGHLVLCQGQGEELAFLAHPHTLTLADALRIYERKTAAAFEVALSFGVIVAGANGGVRTTLARFSRAVGIAYQIRDDLEDYTAPQQNAATTNVPLRPNVLFALACESDDPAVQRAITALLAMPESAARDLAWHKIVFDAPQLTARARQLFEHHRHEAERALAGLQHSDLRLLLRRVTGRVFQNEATPAS
jgi:geranylgeranyl pyrophosphate synthase